MGQGKSDGQRINWEKRKRPMHGTLRVTDQPKITAGFWKKKTG